MDLVFFECGLVFYGGESGEQENFVIGIFVGCIMFKDIYGESCLVDVFDVKVDMEVVFEVFGVFVKLIFNCLINGWWYSGCLIKVGLGLKKIFGVFGELYLKIIEVMDVKGLVVVFVIYIVEILMFCKFGVMCLVFSVSDLQVVECDFVFVVDSIVEVINFVNVVGGVDKELIEFVWVFDEFIGEKVEVQMGEGKKFIVVIVCFQLFEVILKEKDIEVVFVKIVVKVEKVIGGMLCGQVVFL